jgi:hypothetical protein
MLFEEFKEFKEFWRGASKAYGRMGVTAYLSAGTEWDVWIRAADRGP